MTTRTPPTPAVRGGAARAADVQRRPDRVRRGLARLGLPRGRLRVRACGPPDRSAPVGEPGDDAAAGAMRPRPPMIPRGPAAETALPGARIYRATVMHRRHANAPGAVDRTFRYWTYYWLVDVDDLPGRSRGRCGRSPGSAPRTTSATRRRLGENVAAALRRARPRGGPDPAADLSAGGRPRVQPAVGLLLPRHAIPTAAPSGWSRSSPRCTTPTAGGTSTCCGPTTPAGTRSTSSSTSRRSCRWAART